MVRGPAVILRSERSELRRTAGHLTMTGEALSQEGLTNPKVQLGYGVGWSYGVTDLGGR
jgi:hypothetical protein